MPLPTRAEMRGEIVEALYPISANTLPLVCSTFGLRPGTRDEAMNSKRAYILNRLDFDLNRLRDLGAEIEREYPRYALAEMLAKLAEAGQPELGEVARRRIIMLFRIYPLTGDIDIIAFLDPIWPLASMTTPGVFGDRNMKEAIIQHRIRNDDWTDEQLLDELGVLTCSRQRFFHLLEAAVHPRTRDDETRASLIERMNELLRLDGWSLVTTSRTSGLPVYTVQAATPSGRQPADAATSEGLAAFDEESVHAMWQKALDRRIDDPQGAITAARTLLETVCKHILDDASVAYQERDDLPKLYRATANVMHLAPSQHTEEVFRQILGGCTAVVEGIGSLRNRLSDAHGQGRLPTRPKTRHAQLVVTLAGATAVFLVTTWADKQDPG